MADLKCEKCDRKFVHGKRLETHAAKCTGGGGPVQRKRRKVTTVSHEVGVEDKRAVTTVAWTPTFSGTLDVSPKRVLLEQLHIQEASLEKQLAEVRALRKGVAEIEVDPS